MAGGSIGWSELDWRTLWPYTKVICRTVRVGINIEMTIEPGYQTVQLRMRQQASEIDLVDLDLRDVRTVSVERHRSHELLRVDFPDDTPAATLWLRMKPDAMLVWSYGQPRFR